MKYHQMYPEVPDAEATTRADMDGQSHTFRAFSLPVPGEGYTLDGFLCRRKQPEDNTYFYKEKYPKDLVVLHFTAGYFRGDVGALTKPGRHVSTSYLLGRDGTVYQLFSSSQWSYHLGRSAVGGNTFNSKRSVAIEISNIGPLKLVGQVLKDTYGNDYCRLEDQDAYRKLDAPYRGFTYYASFTDKQYEELIILLRYLMAVYDAPASFLPTDARPQLFASAEEARSYQGIASHVNFRRDKFDIGPAFDWQRVIDGITAERYEPQLRVRSRSLGPMPDINSVEELETEIATYMQGVAFDPATMEEAGEETIDASVRIVGPWEQLRNWWRRVRSA